MRARFIRFCSVGFLGTCINLLVFYVCSRFYALSPNPSSILAFSVAVTNNYIFNHIWTFSNEVQGARLSFRKYVFYVFGNLLGLSINLIVLNTIISIFGKKYGLAGQAVGIVTGLVFNYMFARHLVFNSRLKFALNINPATFLCFIFIGLGASVAFHAYLNDLGYVYPWNTFLWDPGDRYNDWFNTVRQAGSANPYYSDVPALATYFPLTYLILKIGVVENPGVSLFIYFIVCLLLLVAATYLTLNNNKFAAGMDSKTKILNMALLSLGCLATYPFLFSLDRGNIDVWIGLIAVIFIATYDTKYNILGLVLLAVAIALKGYPAAFLLIYLSKRKWISAASCLGLALGMTFLTLAVFWDGFRYNLDGFKYHLEQFKEIYVLGGGSLSASSDPYNAIRLLFQYIQKKSYMAGDYRLIHVSIQDFSANLMAWYKFASFTVAAICSLFVLFAKAADWKKVVAVCLITILFPAVSNDYKLCLLFPGVFVLIRDNSGSFLEKSAFLLLCTIMIPKSYYFIDGRSISMLINPVLLILLLCLVLTDTTAWVQGYTRITAFVSRRESKV